MKGWSLEKVGTFQYKEDLQNPVANEDRVLVKVKAAGICGSDIPRIYETGAHKMPLIIGHEFSGVVADVASDTDKELVGKKVGVFPLIPCRCCNACKKKQYEMCSNYSYLGSREDGGFAEYVTVPKWNLLELPENVSYKSAAMLEPMAVAVHAMRSVKIEKDSTVVVTGVGTIGQLLCQFLMEAGVNQLLVVGNKDTQKKTLIKSGLKEENYLDARTADSLNWIMDKTDGVGADVFFECVGQTDTVLLGINAAAPKGQIVYVGNPHSDMLLPRDIYWKILRKQLQVVGTWNSSFYGKDDEETKRDDWHYVLKRLKEGAVHPEYLISHEVKLSDLEKGALIMKNKSEEFLKVMCVFED